MSTDHPVDKPAVEFSIHSLDMDDHHSVTVPSTRPCRHARSSVNFNTLGLEWSNVNYKVATEHKGVRRRATEFKTILHNVSGSVIPGEMVAIMGSSGAGKSTLLNALSGRLTTGKLDGQIQFVGRKRDPSTFKKQAAYVEQDDIMYPQLTVRETIAYAAKLRLPKNEYSASDKAAKVDRILDALRLTGVADTYIGDAMIRGVSGGERKRTAIGVELVTDPEFMFLDEATSGLDSNSAYHVCDVVKEAGRYRNMGVLMTIHQPSAKILGLFDKIILLSKGQLVYYGPVSMALDYFGSQGYHCGQYENPADFYLDLMTIDSTTEESVAQSHARVDQLVKIFKHYSAQHPELCLRAPRRPVTMAAFQECQEAPSSTTSSPPTESDTDTTYLSSPPNPIQPAKSPIDTEPLVATNKPTGWALPWIFEFGVLLDRCWKAQLRNKFYIVANVAQYTIMTLLMGFTFFQIDYSQSSIQNRLGMLFFLPIGLIFGISMPLLGIFSLERNIMLRERSAGSYRVTAFYLAKFLTELPLTILTAGVYVTGVYFLTHLQYEVGKFFIYLGVQTLGVVVAVSMGLAIGATFETLQVAQIIAPLLITLFFLYAGNLVNTDDVTPVLSWLRFISPIKYCYQALAINEFSGLTFICAHEDTSTCFKTGEAVLNNYALDSLAIKTCAALLVAIGVAFHACIYASLRWKSKPRYLWI
ncbi:hypothetical protein H4R34_003261 [Dimargaris verticillata]|uniref:ABC transporter domain-containing protein n=1 Tax=Dimargaris verticillata TaxID=2761393 RepID=A0A9W8EDB5_9FUNG|nr:hypothetical protein H4R34_003261 [Dimargaris verticillata]